MNPSLGSDTKRLYNLVLGELVVLQDCEPKLSVSSCINFLGQVFCYSDGCELKHPCSNPRDENSVSQHSLLQGNLKNNFIHSHIPSKKLKGSFQCQNIKRCWERWLLQELHVVQGYISSWPSRESIIIITVIAGLSILPSTGLSLLFQSVLALASSTLFSPLVFGISGLDFFE